MKIISKFRDCYDSVSYQASQGIDDGPLYLRTTNKTLLKSFPAEISKLLKMIPAPRAFNPHARYPQTDVYRGEVGSWVRGIIAFCGNAYPVYVRPFYDWHDNIKGYSGDFLSHCSLFPEDKSTYQTVPNKKNSTYYSVPFCEETVNKAWESVSGQVLPNTIFNTYDSPVLLFVHMNEPNSHKQTPCVIVNPVLQDLEFYRHIDLWTMFQEISMFIGNILTQPDGAAYRVGDDEVILRSKGFDEWSFKTMPPGQKKLNRRNNKIRKRNSE